MTARANKRRKARARRRLRAWRSQGFRYLWRGARVEVDVQDEDPTCANCGDIGHEATRCESCGNKNNCEFDGCFWCDECPNCGVMTMDHTGDGYCACCEPWDEDE